MKLTDKEIDILATIIAVGDCCTVNCDGVETDYPICNEGTVCPLQERGCSMYASRDTKIPKITFDELAKEVVSLAKQVLND